MPNVPEVFVTSKIHPLLIREIRPMRNWLEFLERWDAATTVNEMLGILHAGFTVSFEKLAWNDPEYDSIDRILFYLRVADGWADPYCLLRSAGECDAAVPYYDPNGNRVMKSTSDLRGAIALKAFDMLCLNVFRTAVPHDGNGYSLWEQKFASERLLPAIQDFFRTEASPFGTLEVVIRNLSMRREPSHNEKFACEFLLRLSEFVWDWRESPITVWQDEDTKQRLEKQNVSMRPRLDAAKLWVVDLLVGLDRLNLLRGRILSLRPEHIARLQEIALQTRLEKYAHPVNEDRLVRTLDEACYAGSRTAWFLKKRDLIVREHERLTAIREAEKVRTETNLRLMELQG